MRNLIQKYFQLNIKRFLLLLIIFIIAVFLGICSRLLPSKYREDKYFISSDSYRHVRHMRQIINGKLPEIDKMRNVPLGYKNENGPEIFFPWMLAFTYKITRYFFNNLSIWKFLVSFSILSIILAFILFFAVAKKIFNSSVALFAIIPFTMMPLLIHRSIAGYIDTDTMNIIMFLSCLYLYDMSFSHSFSKRIWSRILFSIMLGLWGLIWQGVGIGAVMFYGIDIIYREKRKNKAENIVELFSVVLYLSILLVLSNTYRKLDPFVIIAIGPGILVILDRLIYLSSFSQIFSYKVRLAVVVVSMIALFSFKPELIQKLSEHLLYTFGKDPIMRNIGELSPFGFASWWRDYGITIILGLSGFYWLIYKQWQKIKPQLRHPILHIVGLSLAFLAMILSRGFISSLLEIPELLGLLFLIGPILWLAIHVIYLLRIQYDNRFTLIFFWFLISFNLATAAIRFNIFFAPILALLNGFIILELYNFILPESEANFFTYSIICLAILGWEFLLFGTNLISKTMNWNLDNIYFSRILLFVAVLPSFFILLNIMLNIIRKYSNFSKRAIRYIGFLVIFGINVTAFAGIYGCGVGRKGYEFASQPVPVPRVKEAVEWIKENTPAEAVIATEWDYASIVNELAHRATIIDECQNIPWIRDFHRGLCSPTITQIKSFFSEHKANYLMLSVEKLFSFDELWQSAHISEIPDNMKICSLRVIPAQGEGRLAQITFLPTKKLTLKSKRTGQNIDVDKLIIEYGFNENMSPQIYAPQIISKEDNKYIVKELVIGTKSWEFPKADIAGTVWLPGTNLLSNRPNLKISRALFITNNVKQTTIAKLFLEDSLENDIKLKYASKDDYVRIWKIR